MTAPILYLGPEGTHSHEAARQRFGPTANLIPSLSHPEVFERLTASRARPKPFAVVPVENSIEGTVIQTLDQLARFNNISILDSFSFAVHNHLMALPKTNLADIRQVCSHPQALGQCRQTLAKLVPNARHIAESSTAAAARRAATEPGTAAIAAAAAASLHHLAILKKNVQDNKGNVTRFFTLTASKPPARTQAPAAAANDIRSLIYLVTSNRPGALLHVLSPFDASDINLTFIQSRPLLGRPWEYGFFIEAATDWSASSAKAAWQLIRALSESARKIGTYPVA